MNLPFDSSLRAHDESRRAALAMHALPEIDRAWILRQLPPAQRERLDALLGELKALAIPANRVLVQELLAEAVQTPAPAVQAAGETQQQFEAIAGLEAALLSRVLQAEPVALIAHLLDLRRWPWHDTLLEQLGVVKRRRVEDALQALRAPARRATPERLHRSIVAVLSAHAAAEAARERAAAPVPVISTRGARLGWPSRLSVALLRRHGGRA
jgi:hypothetical protein